MKLICNKCNTSIPSKNINLKEGICSCSNCDEFFKVADFLDSDEEVRRLPKPLNTKVTIEDSYDTTKIIIPSSGLRGASIFLLLFSVVWNIVVWLLLVPSDVEWWFKLIFVSVGLVVLATFFISTFLKNSLIFINGEIKIVKDVLGLRIVKNRSIQDLDEITESVMYTQNYQPVYGVEICFVSASNFKFGSALTESERKWLIGELYELKDKYSNKRR